MDSIKQFINTGSRAPTRQPLQITPVHWKDNEDQQIDEMFISNVI